MDDRLAASRQPPPPPVADDGHPEVLPVTTACIVCRGEMVNSAPCKWCETLCCSERCLAEHYKVRHLRDTFIQWALGVGSVLAALAVLALFLWNETHR